jgi:hypothetical protein
MRLLQAASADGRAPPQNKHLGKEDRAEPKKRAEPRDVIQLLGPIIIIRMHRLPKESVPNSNTQNLAVLSACAWNERQTFD